MTNRSLEKEKKVAEIQVLIKKLRESTPEEYGIVYRDLMAANEALEKLQAE